MRRTGVLVAVVALVAAIAAIVRIGLRGPSYAPVVAPSALDAWRAAWTDPPPRERTAMPKRWIVIGWDGAGWDLALPLVDAGKMPNLAGLMREGAYGTMYSFKPTWSPVLWTTVATGVDPRHHGILAWGRVDKKQRMRRRLFTNADRRVRALWNLMTDAGRPSLVVGYHNTFPADRIDGLMVSNFLYHEHLEERMNIPGDAEESGLVYPPKRLAEILAIQDEVRRSMPSAISRFARFDAAEAADYETPLARALRPGEDERKFFLKKAWLFDTMTGRIAEAEYPVIRPELAMVHFQCIDFASHYFLYFADPARFSAMPWSPQDRAALDAEAPHYRETVEAFYRYADLWLGRQLAQRDEETGVLLLSDHGFAPEDKPNRTGGHDDAPPGIFVVAGPGIRPGRQERGATLYDVMPTLAAALGLPLADGLRGRPQAGWFTTEAWSTLRIERVARYDSGKRYVPDIPVADETEKELLDQLRAIGYVK